MSESSKLFKMVEEALLEGLQPLGRPGKGEKGNSKPETRIILEEHLYKV